MTPSFTEGLFGLPGFSGFLCAIVRLRSTLLEVFTLDLANFESFSTSLFSLEYYDHCI